MEGSSSRRNLFHAWRNRLKLTNSFWKRWSQEYVRWEQITPASWARSPSDDRLPRLRWKLGRIQEIFKE